MNRANKNMILSVLFIIMFFSPVSSLLAQADRQIQDEIKIKIASSAVLQGIRVGVHVEQHLVVLTGEVQFYEQKMILERIAWTSHDVYEVDNELRIVPLRSYSDKQIKENIRKIVEENNNFRISLINIKVDKGLVTIKGSFLDFRDPLRLKHKVAAIEGVLAIKIDATFLITPVQLDEVAYTYKNLQLDKPRTSNSVIKL